MTSPRAFLCLQRNQAYPTDTMCRYLIQPTKEMIERKGIDVIEHNSFALMPSKLINNKSIQSLAI